MGYNRSKNVHGQKIDINFFFHLTSKKLLVVEVRESKHCFKIFLQYIYKKKSKFSTVAHFDSSTSI